MVTAKGGQFQDVFTLPPGQASSCLYEAITSGMIVIRDEHATILAPPNLNDLTDDDWIDILQAATEVGRELEALGYEVTW